MITTTISPSMGAVWTPTLASSTLQSSRRRLSPGRRRPSPSTRSPSRRGTFSTTTMEAAVMDSNSIPMVFFITTTNFRRHLTTQVLPLFRPVRSWTVAFLAMLLLFLPLLRLSLPPLPLPLLLHPLPPLLPPPLPPPLPPLFPLLLTKIISSAGSSLQLLPLPGAPLTPPPP